MVRPPLLVLIATPGRPLKLVFHHPPACGRGRGHREHPMRNILPAPPTDNLTANPDRKNSNRKRGYGDRTRRGTVGDDSPRGILEPACGGLA